MLITVMSPPGKTSIRFTWPVYKADKGGKLIAAPTLNVSVEVHPASAQHLKALCAELRKDFCQSNSTTADRLRLVKRIVFTRHREFIPLAFDMLRCMDLWPAAYDLVHFVVDCYDRQETSDALLLGYLSQGKPHCYQSIFDYWRVHGPAFTSRHIRPLQESPDIWIRSLAYVTFPGLFSEEEKRELLNELRGTHSPRLSRRITRLILALDDDSFRVREEASAELEGWGELVEPDLRNLLRGPSSPEVIRRASILLERLAQRTPNPDAISALSLIEYRRTPAAMDVLGALAEGDPRLWRTKEAQAALERLKARKP